ncbi:NAD(P)-dependent oxidoreductase [Nakamurella flavida]|uniref:NAD(P)-dependent oxidoreductase n=1 Tax=Nakamurella flavida TaxID=363630 RepID=A0A938YP72_9ACTN|nr:NAD(P)-dependent oxidoreductase [Nakamurella flavida]MBM9478166.1 NAD(P)-dependent oxidoreductase [Nakamurella flavida]MDP9778612.1 3-hydroxyisobutyrate dehydrogenase [Nakamurella flavida]
MRVAVLGTGIMGAGVTRSLLRAGHQVVVWNRNRARAEPLTSDGATVADTPTEAVADAEVVLAVLYDTASVLDVLGEAAGSAAARTIWVQMSTIGLDGTQAVAALAAERGLTLVEAMMLGTRAPAEQGKLVLLTAGDPATLDRLTPVFDAVSVRTVAAGPDLGAATALKLAANAWVASLTALVGQSLSLADGLGVDPDLFLQAIAGGATDTPYAHVKGRAMLSGDFDPSFALDGARKDLGLIRAAADRAGVSGEILGAVSTLYDRASEAGHGEQDMAAVVTAFRD